MGKNKKLDKILSLLQGRLITFTHEGFMFMDTKTSNKKYAASYKQGRTTTADPNVLEAVNYDDKKFKGKDGHIDFDKISEVYDRNHAVIRGWDDAAKKTKKWIGRTLTECVGEGRAIYVVVKENKKTVKIKVCRGLGDDWVSRHFGEECSISKTQACGFFPFSFSEKRVLPYDMVAK